MAPRRLFHHLAATTLSKIGEADLAWIAAERAMHAADESDDPLVLASAARSGTHALLAQAVRAADQLGVGGNYWQTSFGPSDVEVHRVSAALDLVDITEVIDSVPRINVERLSLERQVTHLIDLARALSLVVKVGFADLLVSMHGGTIVFDPHVTGECVIALDEDGGKTLRNILTEWLG